MAWAARPCLLFHTGKLPVPQGIHPEADKSEHLYSLWPSVVLCVLCVNDFDFLGSHSRICREATIDRHDGAGDKATAIARKPYGCGDKFFGFTKTAQWGVVDDLSASCG